MTREQWAKLKPEEQRIKVSACIGERGWWISEYPDKDGNHPLVTRRDGETVRLPDYLNDLNAMHEAEKTIYGWEEDGSTNITQWGKWIAYQCILCDTAPHSQIHATASQRAEAFVLTMEGGAE